MGSSYRIVLAHERAVSPQGAGRAILTAVFCAEACLVECLGSAANVGLSCLIGFGRTRSATEYLGVAAQPSALFLACSFSARDSFCGENEKVKKAGRPARILSAVAGRFVVPGRKSWFGGSVRKLLGSWHALVSGCTGNAFSQTGALRSGAAMAIAADVDRDQSRLALRRRRSNQAIERGYYFTGGGQFLEKPGKDFFRESCGKSAAVGAS